MKDLTVAMDDTGFRVSAHQPAPAALAPARLLGAAPLDRPRRLAVRASGPWAWGVAGAVVAHVLLLGPPLLARFNDLDRRAPPPVVMYLDLTPPPAPRIPDRPKPASQTPAPAAPRTEPATPPPPVVARAPVQAPPPSVAPAPLPAARPAAPAPAPPTEAAQPAPAPAPSRPSAPSPEFQRKVLAALERVRRYPPAAKARREEGVVVVSFTMNRSGKVLSASVQSSSGSATLDRAALETVRRASLPRVPAEFGDPLRLTVPVEFAVR